MAGPSLADLTVDQLVENFGELAVAHAEARAVRDIATVDDCRNRTNEIERELKARGAGDQAYEPLARHPDRDVGFEAMAAAFRGLFDNATISANMIRRVVLAHAAEAGAPGTISTVAAMDRTQVQALATPILVERFKALAIAYDEAESMPESERLYWQLDDVKNEFFARDGEQWRALLPFYLHPDIRVRHQAAEATQTPLPELARARLLAIDDEAWEPPGAFADLFACEQARPAPDRAKGRRQRTTLASMSVADLVERFIVIALDQDDALSLDQIAGYNRLFWMMEAVTLELASRPGDERSALLPLLDHANLQVRLKAAKATLAIAPESARAALASINASQIQPQALDAGMCLSNLDRGIFKPT